MAMAEPVIESDPGYGYLEEGMAVEEDHMGEGALRFTLIGMILLLVIIFATIQWATLEGQVASEENAVYEPSPALREANAAASQKLNQYGVVDPVNGRYRIPIERAMSIMAAENAERPVSTEAE